MVEPLKIQPVEQCGAVGKCQSHPSGYEHACSSYRKPTKERVAAYALQQLEAARAKDVAAHEANQSAIENNQAIVARVTALMNEIGLPARWSEMVLPRGGRYKKNVGHDAGYITDLRRECKTEDGFDAATRTYSDLRKRYEEYAEQGMKEAEADARQQEQARQDEIEKRKADMELVAILMRYTLPIDSSWSDVLEHLRGMNQRLDLAVAMQQTRGDWSDGAYRVSAALERFTIRDDEDKSIAACVCGCLAEFEDGRVFRDTSWSYDRLFASVGDRQLVADVQLAAQREST